MDSSPSTGSKMAEPTLPTAAGVKRPAPSLLPAFEPLSSSPVLPRPAKRHAGSNAFLKYPTPVPTSSTGILSSSPPRLGSRPPLKRTLSSASERTPLSSVPSVQLNENGEVLLMGRSSSSSHYQLSANRLISRVHVKARYVPASNPLEPNKIEIVCTGWNGLKLHCQGQTWELAKGDSFTSETEGAEIMLDVQDARVLVRWPRKDKDHDALGHLSDSTWDESPRRNARAGSELPGSPLKRHTRLASPESPTPANLSTSIGSLDGILAGATHEEDDDAPVEIYEDASADEKSPTRAKGHAADRSFATQKGDDGDSFSSDLSDPQSDDDNENENDPIFHSFAFANSFSNAVTAKKVRQPRRSLAHALESSPLGITNNSSSSTDSNTQQETPAAPAAPAPQELDPATRAGMSKEAADTLRNHMVNQLAFSRLSSTPLSTIMNNLPADERRTYSREQLRIIIESTPCVGIIRRQGKDAAGKPLESEYYYTPELDEDEQRRIAVTDGLRKPTLRNCRKQHKQYYWKRPRTP
ncbi:hypothetical protein VTJ04DRAFT_5334 [Mycothermus thermophilus]|uniref:uncharacterized protein n=1 Tax=Humicola insolens TaxID=85995 RepID=UPI003743DD91